MAIYHTKLIQSDWQKTADCTVTLRSLDLSAVWQCVVTQVDEIHVEGGNTLEQQIAVDEQRAKVQKEVARLEKLARKKMQPKKKFELAQELYALRLRFAAVKEGNQ